MAKNYGTRRSRRQRGSAPQQFLVIVVTFLLGYLTASVFDVQTVGQWINSQVLAYDKTKQQAPQTANIPNEAPPKPKFEFYTLLANEKASAGAKANATQAAPTHNAAAIPAAQQTASAALHAATSPTRQNSLASAAASNSWAKGPIQKPTLMNKAANQAINAHYLVQVAAFKARQDAEHMKGTLILKGFEVHVVPVTNARGNWFRVVVGPYANRNLAQRAQALLARNEHLKGMLVSSG